MSTITDQYGREHSLPGPFKNLNEVKTANRKAGHYWFSKDTLAFFDSEIEPGVEGGRLFITSEQRHHSDGTSEPRLFTIRCASDEGHITTVGDFQDYKSYSEATEAVATLLEEVSA